MEIPKITKEQYDQVVANQENAFLIFTKENCKVCARLAPTMEKLADAYSGNPDMHFYNMEIHDPEARALFKGWQLVGVPQTCIIKNGQYQEALPGALTEDIYKKEIKSLLSDKNKQQKGGFGAKLRGLFGK